MKAEAPRLRRYHIRCFIAVAVCTAVFWFFTSVAAAGLENAWINGAGSCLTIAAIIVILWNGKCLAPLESFVLEGVGKESSEKMQKEGERGKWTLACAASASVCILIAPYLAFIFSLLELAVTRKVEGNLAGLLLTKGIIWYGAPQFAAAVLILVGFIVVVKPEEGDIEETQ